MEIKIAQRLRPFSHLPGTLVPLPFSDWQVEAFPAFLKLSCSTLQIECPTGWKGPVFDFTVQLDLEKGLISLYGHTAEGYRRLWIRMIDEGIELWWEKEGEKRIILGGKRMGALPLERLSLGMHKALDWELVRRRCDLKELLPVWHRLGQMVPTVGDYTIEENLPLSRYLELFLVGFKGILAPRLVDTEHQGLNNWHSDYIGSPIALLTEGARLIRALFFKEVGEVWHLLDSLPAEFHAGRFIGIHTCAGDHVQIEWSSKRLNRVLIYSKSDRNIYLKTHPFLKSFRLRYHSKKRGARHAISEPIELVEGSFLILDRFEK